jgi:Spy/CpxP family protein refolding chaperone
MRTRLAAAVVFLATIVAAPAWAQAPAAPDPTSDIDALRAAVRADKRALVAKTLDLTPQEAKKFWPIYDKYQRFVDRTNRRSTAPSRTW